MGMDTEKETSGLRSANHADVGRPPVAFEQPHVREVHGDVFVDPYEWMRDKDSARLRDYVRAQNEYYADRMRPLSGLKDTLFEEFKGHVQETDMSVPTRIDDYWYFARTREGSQYGVQCRIHIRGRDDWHPPVIDMHDEPGAAPDEEIVFDMNAEAQGHDFFQLGGLDLSRDGRFLLYGVDTTGNERYDYRIRDLSDHHDLPDLMPGVGGACMTADGRWVFYVRLDEAWRPCAVVRHRVGTAARQDVEVFRERDERFWVGVSLSFDERHVVIGTGSKTTSEVLLLPVDDPEGEFRVFLPRTEGVEYDVSFASFEGAGQGGSDIPLALVYHNAFNPNFEIDVVDMRMHEPPFSLGEGTCIAVGSPYGCERGDAVERGASRRHVGEPYFNSINPEVLQGAKGLSIDGIAMYRHFVQLGYQAGGLPHVAVITKEQAAADFLAGRPWAFLGLEPHKGLVRSSFGCEPDEGSGYPDDIVLDFPRTAGQGEENGGEAGSDIGNGQVPGDLWGTDSQGTRRRRLYCIGTGGNPSYDAPRLRYSFSSYSSPGELHEIDVCTGEDVLLKRMKVLGDFDSERYRERRVWVEARDGELVPVSLVWREGIRKGPSAMFVTGYGAYEVNSDPGFSVSRLGMLDRGVLYAVVHVRGGGEMGRAWYEQGRRLNKRNTFEDFVDATRALQRCGLADSRRTVANGGSAGGLLMGAVANMAPECYAGIEADVPFVDALTSILDPSLPLTVTEWDEWGDPLHDRLVYEYMKSYTPYENAPYGLWSYGRDDSGSRRPAGGVRFPRILATTSMNDTRVLYVEPLKWVARLQSQGVDAMIRVETEAGHGGVSGRYAQWREVCEENAWCLHVMGIDV